MHIGTTAIKTHTLILLKQREYTAYCTNVQFILKKLFKRYENWVMSRFQPVFIKRLSIVTLYQMAKLFRFLQIPATIGACWFAFFRPRHISIYKPFLIICPEKLLTTRDFGKETTSSASRRRVGPGLLLCNSNTRSGIESYFMRFLGFLDEGCAYGKQLSY